MQESSPLVIAIDGLSASGKGTIGKRMADHFDFAYLDTGLLYRAVGVLALAAGVALTRPEAIADFARTLGADEVIAKLADPALKSGQAGENAAKVSSVREVRDNLLNFQKDFYKKPPEGKKGAVLDGRDIGIVICPEAPVKIYVTAEVDIRAERRLKELQKRNETVTYPEVLAALKLRDERDLTRSVVPALPAKDAVILDTSKMTADEAFETALAIVRQKVPALA